MLTPTTFFSHVFIVLLLLCLLEVGFKVSTASAAEAGSSPRLPDLNGDGVIDMKDVRTVAGAFGSQPGDPNWNSAADLNYDGEIDMRDIALVVEDFGKSCRSYDFNDLSGWNVSGGNWSVQNGALEGFSRYEGLIYAGDVTWKEFTLTAKVKIAADSPQAEAAFCFCFGDSGYFYWAGLGCWGHKVSVSRMVGHVAEELAFQGDRADVAKDVWYVVSIKVAGDSLALYVNDVLELATNDSTFSEGAVGIRAWNSHIVVDYVVVSGFASFRVPTNDGAHAPLHADGTRLLDSSGKEVYLKSINVHLNERESAGGRYWTLDDVKRIKEADANCIELHAELLCDWMPERNQIDETYFVNWLDKQVSWCEQYEIFYIINLRGFGGNTDWARKEPFLPDWLWKDLGYAEPTNQELADIIIRDFFDTNVEKQEINREAFIRAWKFVASRYKNNRHALFGLMNEPLCGVEIAEETSRHLGITYSVLMSRVIDAIRSAGAQQLIFVDRPYVWYLSHVQPIDRPDIVWEDHSYVSPFSDINSWKSDIDDMIKRFVYEFNKPLFIGEYGIDPYSILNEEPWKTTWKSILEEQVAYLDGKPICGRQWHAYDFLDGEYMAYFNEEESQWILQTVLGS